VETLNPKNIKIAQREQCEERISRICGNVVHEILCKTKNDVELAIGKAIEIW
jgi:hypothetical protein